MCSDSRAKPLFKASDMRLLSTAAPDTSEHEAAVMLFKAGQQVQTGTAPSGVIVCTDGERAVTASIDHMGQPERIVSVPARDAAAVTTGPRKCAGSVSSRYRVIASGVENHGNGVSVRDHSSTAPDAMTADEKGYAVGLYTSEYG